MPKASQVQAMVWCAICIMAVQAANAGTKGLSGPSLLAVGDLDRFRQPVILSQSGSETARPPDTESEAASKNSVDVQLYDLELEDQDGTRLKFKSEVVGDKIAVIIPFYTTCTTSYPILIFMFTRLQEMLGEHLGKDVVLVSISVDPKTDIPTRLKAYARRQKAKPGWIFLSGERNNLGQVLLGVGALYSPSLEDHNHIPVAVVGSVRTEWRRFHGFPSPDQIIIEINKLLAARQQP